MIIRTNAFNTLQNQVQETFDFAVMVCHAVPSLKLQMKLLDDGIIHKLPDPDYFTKNTTEELRDQADGYKENLATYLFLSSFAFFENYFGAVLDEIFDFNVTIPNDDTLKECLNNNTDTKSKRALKGHYDKRHQQRYEKFSNELKSNNYITPEELKKIVAYTNLYKTIKDLKANQIPDFLINHLKIEITEDEKSKFNTYRQLRNEIAHGDRPSLTLRKVREANSFLRKLASKIDDFLSEHYKKLNNYV
jgi:hypothetical protein